MKPLFSFLIQQNVFFNLLFVGIMAFGLFIAIPNLPVERYPNINFGDVSITTNYPGASAEDVERLVTEEIEDSLRGMENIEFIRSSSKSGFSNINVKFIDDTDYDALYDEMRLRILGVQNRFPVVNGKPLSPNFNVTTVDDWLPVIQINLMSASKNLPLSKRSLSRLAEELQLQLEEIEGVKEVRLSGKESQQFILSLNAKALLSYGVSLQEIQNALVQGGGSLPAGIINTSEGEVNIQVEDSYRNKEDLLQTVVRKDSDGTLLFVSDLVDLEKTQLERIQGGIITSVNGADTVSCKITKTALGNAKTIKQEVLKVSNTFIKNHAALPITLNTTLDSTIKIDDGLGVLQSSLAMSIILVMLAIFLFLSPSKQSTMLWVSGLSVASIIVMVRFNDQSNIQLIILALNTLLIFATCRAAVLTVSGIAFSFIGCLVMFHLTGYSINEITLLGFVLTSGIIVDDAIVVLENIQRLREKGLTIIQAAIEGTIEVFWPVVSASLTTIAAFMPMLMMSGATGEFFALIPITVSTALLISLFECLCLMPIHNVDLDRLKNRWSKNNKTQQLPEKELVPSDIVNRLTKFYDHILNWCLVHHKWSLSVVGILFALSISILIQSAMGPNFGFRPLLKLKFFPDDTSNLQIEYRNPPSSSLQQTDQLGRNIARYLIKMGSGNIKSVTANAGMSLDSAYKPFFGNHLGFMIVELPEKSKRNFDNANSFIERVRLDLESQFEKNGIELEVTAQKDGPPVGAPIHVRASGVDEENVIQLGKDLFEYLKLNNHKNEFFDGITDLKSDRSSSSQTLIFKTRLAESARQGLLPSEVRYYASTLFDGAYVGDLRLENEDVPIRMRLHDGENISPNELLHLPIVDRAPRSIFYEDVGEMRLVDSPASLERRDYQRIINITSNIREDSILQSNDFIDRIQTWYSERAQQYPGAHLAFGGESESTGKSYRSLMSAFFVSIFVIYGILAVQFKSYSQPLLIMSNIIFSFIGVVLMLGLVGVLSLILPSDTIAPERAMITVQSFIAMVGLTGLVVNDAIVLIDFINHERRRGLSLDEAVCSGAHKRVRPIIMTTWSTIAGLLPLAIGIPDFSITWGPFATCFVAGLSMSTLITLLIIPVLYHILENFKIKYFNTVLDI